jgi:hypothetical protein
MSSRMVRGIPPNTLALRPGKHPSFLQFFTVWTRSVPRGYIFAVNTGKRRSLEAATPVA